MANTTGTQGVTSRSGNQTRFHTYGGRTDAYSFIYGLRCHVEYMISLLFAILKGNGGFKKHTLRELIYHNERKLQSETVKEKENISEFLPPLRGAP